MTYRTFEGTSPRKPRVENTVYSLFNFRLRLNERGLQSIRIQFYGLKIASKTTRFRSFTGFQAFVQEFSLYSVWGSAYLDQFSPLESANFAPEYVAVFKLMRLRRFQTVTRLRFTNALLLKAFSKRNGFNVGLDRCCVNERGKCIESDAVANETARPCKRSLWLQFKRSPLTKCTKGYKFQTSNYFFFSLNVPQSLW